MNFNPCSLNRSCNRVTKLLLTAALAYALTACQSTNRLREAQDSFNGAAALENKIRLAPLLGDPSQAQALEQQLNRSSGEMLAEENNVRSGYAATLLSLKNLSRKDKQTLRDDRLWGVALTLQALAEWRLGMHDAAMSTAELAEKDAKDQLFPRDAAVLAAFPGLIKIDLAYDRILAMVSGQSTNTNILDEVRRRLVGVPGATRDESAVNDLRIARSKVEHGHPINAYLIQSQLAAFRNYQVAHFKTYDRNPEETDPAKTEARYNLADLQQLLNELKAGQAGTNIVNTWKNSYGLIPMQRPR